MTKNELIQHLATASNLQQKQVEHLLKNLIKVTEQQLQTEGKFKIHGLISFKTVQRAGRNYRNPATGEISFKEAWTSVTAKPWKNIKEAIE